MELSFVDAEGDEIEGGSFIGSSRSGREGGRDKEPSDGIDGINGVSECWV
jgi:hypothetical protein